MTRTRETRTRDAGHGFPGVRVRVGQKKPRVARDNPYSLVLWWSPLVIPGEAGVVMVPVHVLYV